MSFKEFYKRKCTCIAGVLHFFSFFAIYLETLEYRRHVTGQDHQVKTEVKKPKKRKLFGFKFTFEVENVSPGLNSPEVYNIQAFQYIMLN